MPACFGSAENYRVTIYAGKYWEKVHQNLLWIKRKSPF